MFLDARKFEGLIEGEVEYDGRAVLLHVSHQQAFSGLPRFTLDADGHPRMVGSSIGAMPLQRDPLRFADPCVIVFKESISKPMPKDIRAKIFPDATVAMFGAIFADFIIPKGYYGPLQVTIYPGRRMEIQVGYPAARLYFLDDSVKVTVGATRKGSNAESGD